MLLFATLSETLTRAFVVPEKLCVCVCVCVCVNAHSSSHNIPLTFLVVYQEAEVFSNCYDCSKGSVPSKNTNFGLSKGHVPDTCLFLLILFLTGQHNN